MGSVMPQPLGINKGGYFGERLDYQRFHRELEEVARLRGWRSEVFFESGTTRISALRKTFGTRKPAKRLYISAGIHGDEPAGPLAVLDLLKQDDWPEGVELWICPCLNPAGLSRNTRESEAGLDLNRQYLHLVAEETRAHVAWLERQPDFDLALCLHEDWEAQGFYLYELNPDNRPTHAESIVREVGKVCPIDLSTVIEGRPASGGIVRPSVDPASRPQWPEALYLIRHKTRLSYTLEAPSDFPLATRVASLVVAIRSAF